MNSTCEHPIVRGRRRADAPRRTLVSTPEPATGHLPREHRWRACKRILMEHVKGAPDDDESSSVEQHSHPFRAVCMQSGCRLSDVEVRKYVRM